MFIYLLPYALASVFVFWVLIVLFIISGFGWMKTFQKAGVAGWRAFVPILNDYDKFQISGFGTKAFVIWLVLGIIKSMFPEETTQFVSILQSVVGVLYLVYDINMNVKVSESFGKGTPFGVFLWFFPFIGSYVLGLGESQYVGPKQNRNNY